MECRYAENQSLLASQLPLKTRFRTLARNTVIFFLSLNSRDTASREWIRFPYYHYVFNDEREGFGRQLNFMRNIGEFIGLDDAVEILRRKDKIGGRFFCITFDDGFKNTLTNAAPILSEHSCPAAVFLPTDYIGSDSQQDGPRLKQFYSTGAPVEFLNWDDCITLARAGMTIGSHTCGHMRLADLSMEQVKHELLKSKETIETRLGTVCRHFSAPYGTPDRDFRKERDPELARQAGYASFSTAKRAANAQGADPYFITRDHLEAGWDDYQLRYFFARNCP